MDPGEGKPGQQCQENETLRENHGKLQMLRGACKTQAAVISLPDTLQRPPLRGQGVPGSRTGSQGQTLTQ